MNLLRKVTLDRCNRKKDRSVSFTFTTQLEESSEGFMEIDKLLGSNGVMYFKDSGQLTDAEIKAISEAKIEVGGKSKSKRLMNTIYVKWEQSDSEKTFEDYYADRMEQFIEHEKSTLKPND